MSRHALRQRIIDMEPFYFESQDVELLGIYHPAADQNSRRGIVFCPPLLTDLSRSYHSIGMLAERYAEAGFHVLRFDYSGTGDSFGEWQHGGPRAWVKDIAKAAEELSEISGAESMTLLGIRFGALLALHAAADINPESLILWDPMPDGRSYRSSLDKIHASLVDLHIGLSQSEQERASDETCGFELVPWITSDLEELGLPQNLPDSVENLRLVSTTGSTDLSDIEDRWQKEGRTILSKQVDFDCSWDLSPEAILNPSPVLKELASCL